MYVFYFSTDFTHPPQHNSHVFLYVTHAGDSRHEQPFDCLDQKTASKLLVTTRIKNVLSEGTEIELGGCVLAVVSIVSFVFCFYFLHFCFVFFSFSFCLCVFSELLGVQESVALLATVAQLDSDLVPPVCLEIGGRFCLHLSLFCSHLI